MNTSFMSFMRDPFVAKMVIVAILVLVSFVVLIIGARPRKLSTKQIETIDHQFPCPVCKNDVFKWGNTPSSVIRLKIGLGKPVWARVCQNCGNVQQFTKTGP